MKLLIGLLLGGAGYLCLNYTKGFGMERHVEWAAANGMPEPTITIFFAGVALLALGGIVLGLSLRGRARA